jgi:iron(III) transport system substrate-binding protein
MILEESILKKQEEEQSPLTVIYPEDGSVPVPSPIMIVDAKYSANNNIKAAEALQEYFLSPAGQRLIIKGWMYGVRTDMEEHPYHSKTLTEMMKNTIPVDYEKCLKQRDAIRALIQKEIKN